jgi:uncharacterized membrane protein
MTDQDSLQDVPLFRNVPAELLRPLRDAAVRQVYAAGAPIFTKGDRPEYLYIVERGVVDIVLPTLSDTVILATFEAGSFFGELAVFDRQPRTASAIAMTEAELTCIPHDAVAELVECHPAAAKQFISTIVARLRSADEMLSRHMRNVNEIVDEKMTFAERVADMVARFGGSWTFIMSFGAFLVLWMTVNAAWFWASPMDPYPYIFLNLILSCLAAIQAPVIMMSQNRQAAKDRLQADLEYQVNVKAEFAIQQLHHKVDEMRASMNLHRQADLERLRRLTQPLRPAEGSAQPLD